VAFLVVKETLVVGSHFYHLGILPLPFQWLSLIYPPMSLSLLVALFFFPPVLAVLVVFLLFAYSLFYR
jgi:hypothetical protein